MRTELRPYNQIEEKTWPNQLTKNSKQRLRKWRNREADGARVLGEKGGVSVYGLGRFPVTLYYEQWVRLLEAAPQLRTFLDDNKAEGKLKLKEK